MTPRDLLTAARGTLERPSDATAGLWPRAATFLTRQALEKAIDQLWEADPVTSGLSRCTRRSQLICLPTYLEPRTAHEITYVWAALSQACHYHPYELAPTATELSSWINAVDQLISVINDATGHFTNKGIASARSTRAR
jgi:hypothetical protein